MFSSFLNLFTVIYSKKYCSNCSINSKEKTRKFNPFPNDKFLTLPTSESLQTTILSLMKMAESSPKRWKTLGKGEIARYEQFLFFPQCFQKTCTASHKNQGLFGKGIKKISCHFFYPGNY